MKKFFKNVVKKIGSGSYSIAFSTKDGKVLLASVDPLKAYLADPFAPKSRLFPRIKEVGQEGDWKFFKMPRYNVCSNRNALVKKLNSRQKRLISHFSDWSATQGLSNIIAKFERLPAEFAYEKEKLIEMAEYMASYGKTITFESPALNLAVNKKGQLIFLDCFFYGHMLCDSRRKVQRFKKP